LAVAPFRTKEDVLKRWLTRLALSAVAGLLFAVATGWYERIGRAPPAWDQELCSYSPPRSCRFGVLQSGWPLPYLVDAPGVSRVGQLAFGEDHLRPWAFVADALIGSVIVWLVMAVALRRRS
jgi:hypothetical protein